MPKKDFTISNSTETLRAPGCLLRFLCLLAIAFIAFFYCHSMADKRTVFINPSTFQKQKSLLKKNNQYAVEKKHELKFSEAAYLFKKIT